MQPMVNVKKYIRSRLESDQDPLEVIDQCLRDKNYMFSVNFPRGGTQKIIREFKEWVVKEAKKYERDRRGKASEPPYSCLKWLAALKLDKVRRENRIPIEQMIATLKLDMSGKSRLRGETPPTANFCQCGRMEQSPKCDAKKLLDLLGKSPAKFEKRILY